MPVYNGKRYLKWSVDSILHQTFDDFEFIIINDGSTDSSLRILQRYKLLDQRIKVYDRPNSGIVDALNYGIDVSKGKYIARMDADDIALPDRLGNQVAYMQSQPECVILGTQIYYIDPDGNIVKKSDLKLLHNEIENELLKGNGGAIIHPSSMMRREAVLDVGGYQQETQYVEDLDLYLRLSRIGNLANLETRLLYYRVHYKSVSNWRSVDRHKIRFSILKEAYRTRHIPYDEARLRLNLNYPNSPAQNHRDWAITSLEFGSLRVSIKHAILGCLLDPLNRQSWKCLSYVIKRILKIIL